MESYSQEVMINYIYGILLVITKVKTSMIYNALVENSFVAPSSRNKQKFDISEEDWPKIYVLAGKCGIDSKTKISQYQILSNALYLNKRLFRSKVAESHCAPSGVEDKTVTHLFAECSYSTKLCKELQNSNGLASKLNLVNLSP